MPTTEQMLNVPFSIKINEKLTVKVESLAPAWVTIILKRLGEYRSKKDKPFLESILADAVKSKKANVGNIVDAIYETTSNNMLTLDGEEVETDELEIIRLMTIPNHLWKEWKGNFDEYEWKFSIDDMRESFTEIQLMQIWEEWWKRNPRFDRKKKMMNPGTV
jgi:hypothetical protein